MLTISIKGALILIWYYFYLFILDEEWGSLVPALAQRKEHILLFQTTAIQGEVTLHIHGLPSYASCAGFRVPQLVPLENNYHQNHMCTNRRSAKKNNNNNWCGRCKRKAHSPGASSYCDA